MTVERDPITRALFIPDRTKMTLANLASAAVRLDAGGVWDLEDDEALGAARRLLMERAETAATNG